MGNQENRLNLCASLVRGAVLLASVSVCGCQVDIGGQTLPSPWYLTDDVEYYAPGPEFKLAREAAAQKALRAERVLEE